MKKNILTSILALAFFTSAIAQSKVLKVNGMFITFIIKNALINVKGNFKTGKATLNYDAKNPLNSKFTGIVSSNSINTNNNLRDEHLRDKAEFFDVKKYPEIKMESAKIVAGANGAFNVTWNITMKGITKQVTVPLTIVTNEKGIAFASSFVINRRDWNIGEKSGIMKDNVTINISVNAL
jgi:polyisoprenoid-binding protein YceI